MKSGSGFHNTWKLMKFLAMQTRRNLFVSSSTHSQSFIFTLALVALTSHDVLEGKLEERSSTMHPSSYPSASERKL